MPIAPITGTLRKKIVRDVSVATALGVSAGYAYWYGYQLKHIKQHEEYYINLEKSKADGSYVKRDWAPREEA